jgi:hypothetical protein
MRELRPQLSSKLIDLPILWGVVYEPVPSAHDCYIN